MGDRFAVRQQMEERLPPLQCSTHSATDTEWLLLYVSHHHFSSVCVSMSVSVSKL